MSITERMSYLEQQDRITQSRFSRDRGARIKAARESQGLTFADLTRMTGLPGRTLEEVEMGYSEYDHVKRVCKALGIKE